MRRAQCRSQGESSGSVVKRNKSIASQIRDKSNLAFQVLLIELFLSKRDTYTSSSIIVGRPMLMLEKKQDDKSDAFEAEEEKENLDTKRGDIIDFLYR